jgi:hypothetical protein
METTCNVEDRSEIVDKLVEWLRSREGYVDVDNSLDNTASIIYTNLESIHNEHVSYNNDINPDAAESNNNDLPQSSSNNSLLDMDKPIIDEVTKDVLGDFLDHNSDNSTTADTADDQSKNDDFNIKLESFCK